MLEVARDIELIGEGKDKGRAFHPSRNEKAYEEAD